MRHKVAGRQFGRNSSHRRAMLRSLAAALVKHERIETTVAKAKELRKVADRLVTWAKNGSLSSKRLAQAFLSDPRLVMRLCNDIAPRFKERPGGYTRITKTRRRVGDGASMAIIEFVGTAPPAVRLAPPSEEAASTAAGRTPAASAAAAKS